MKPRMGILPWSTPCRPDLAMMAGLSWGNTAPSHAQTKIVEGFVSHGALQWPEYIATELGWFKENGIELDMLVVGGGAAQQLAAGALNIGYSGYPDFIRATNQGAPVKILINGISAPPYAVFAKPQIKKISELKGKVISIGGSKDVTLIYMESFIGSAGLKAKDVDFVYAKATQDRFAALISGGADAAILYPPATFRSRSARLHQPRRHRRASEGLPFHGMGRQYRLGTKEPAGSSGLRQGIRQGSAMAL